VELIKEEADALVLSGDATRVIEIAAAPFFKIPQSQVAVGYGYLLNLKSPSSSLAFNSRVIQTLTL
jgi:hypothetical protein